MEKWNFLTCNLNLVFKYCKIEFADKDFFKFPCDANGSRDVILETSSLDCFKQFVIF